MQSLIFLDFDDVIALNRGVGGYDVLDALGQVQKGAARVGDFQHIWRNLFDWQAVQHLQQLHDEFSPTYVISSSWTRFMNLEAILIVMLHSGLRFVCRNLHEDWETEKFASTPRSQQIDGWLARHPAYKDTWIALDDVVSGTGYLDGTNPFAVLCKAGVGFQAEEYALARAALQLRKSAC